MSPSELLGRGGLLARAIPGFAPRAAQQEMADAVMSALKASGRLVVEAGTGTGKTYAYLVPALLSGLRVAISTGTRTLQDQLFHRDLPQVRDALAVPVRVALLKGRSNYLCLYRMKRARQQPSLRALFDRLREIEDWARRTQAGELAEFGELGAEPVLLRQITSTADNCLGTRCADYDECFVARARRQAQAADVVVVNHHLLLSDFLLKDQGFGQILAGLDAVIVDEAHQLPELAAEFFGSRVSTRQLQELARDTMLEAQNCGDLPAVVEITQRLSGDVFGLEACFAQAGGRQPLARFLGAAGADIALERVNQSMDELYEALRPLEERNAGLSSALERSAGLREGLKRILEREPDKPAPEPSGSAAAPAPEAHVRWVEALARGGSLHATPVDLAPGFQRMCATYPGAWVFTSATLAAGAQFTHYLDTLGLNEAKTLQLASPFDFQSQARLYLPPNMPEPNAPGYAEAVADAVLPVIEASGGGVFVLCTSHRALRVIAERLRSRLSLNVLTQGESSRSALLDRFVEDGNAVLVGTSSFWEGVDVRGQALRVVAIDRLPFTAPGDPVYEARLDAVRRRGGVPFRDVQLPEAIVTLRQGVGRLIRDPNDRGLLMLCDPRLRSKSYGRTVLAALPEMPLLQDIDAACAWMRETDGVAA